eukprot:7376326-Pyramimonas_sp.AAC.1
MEAEVADHRGQLATLGSEIRRLRTEMEEKLDIAKSIRITPVPILRSGPGISFSREKLMPEQNVINLMRVWLATANIPDGDWELEGDPMSKRFVVRFKGQ